MANKKFQDLTAATTMADADIIPIVADPAGTPADKKITWANIKTTIEQSSLGKRIVQILVTDPNGDAITTGDGKAYFRINSILNGYNLVAVAAHVTTASSSGNPSIAIYNVTQTADMLSTNITIDANEKDSKDATTPAVIDTNNDDVATGDELRIDIDGAGTGTKGLIVELTFQLP